jgi:hypothetical protein
VGRWAVSIPLALALQVLFGVLFFGGPLGEHTLGTLILGLYLAMLIQV